MKIGLHRAEDTGDISFIAQFATRREILPRNIPSVKQVTPKRHFCEARSILQSSLRTFNPEMSFVMPDNFFEVAKIFLFCFQVGFFPVRRGNRAGSFSNESDYSQRVAQIVFPLLDSRSCEKFRLAHCSIVQHEN